MRQTSFTFKALSGLAILVALVMGACSADDTAAPTQPQAVAPPPTNSANTTWRITVTANPDTFDLNLGAGTSQIEVRAVRADNGSRVPANTTALLETTAGLLTSLSGSTGTSIPIQFDDTGVARASLSTGVFVNEGTIIVRAKIENSAGSDVIQMVDVQQAAFQVSGVSPNFGPPAGGTRVSISGSGFESPIRVSFVVGAETLVASDARVSSSSRISATTPAINLPSGQNATASIVVENAFDASGNATGTDTLPSAFTYTRSSSGPTTLKVISVTPTSGPNEGGTQVTILGEGFPQNAQVFFTAAALVEATVLEATPTRLEVITPSATGQNASNANAFVDVVVRDPLTGQEGRRVQSFQYGTPGGSMFISSIAPGQDEYVGGTLTTIFGQGFDEPVAVEMGNEAQQVISVTGTEIVVRTTAVSIGCSPQSGAVQVVNIETAESATGTAFTYFPVSPQIVNISPNSGPSTGGQGFTITGTRSYVGTGFDAPVRVLINGRPAAGAIVTNGDANGIGSIITGTTPAFTGDFTETSQGCPLGQTRPIAEAVAVQVINLDTGCTDTLDEAYLYQPPNGTCTGAILVTADFDFTVTGLQVQFSYTGAGAVTWDWDFGDNAGTSSAQNPSYTYAAAGNYTVTLSVTDGLGGQDTESKVVTVP